MTKGFASFFCLVSMALLAGATGLVVHAESYESITIPGKSYSVPMPDGTTKTFKNPDKVMKLPLLTGDERWGCEVLLCLANPNGPKAVSECHPPIDRLFKCLSKRHPCKFPKCPMAGDGNYAAQDNKSAFDPCSLYGMEDAPEGYVGQGKKSGRKIKAESRYRYNWGGDHYFSGDEGGGGYWGGSKACVRNYVGTDYIEYYSNGDYESRPVRYYEEVMWQPEKSRRVINVFVDGNLYQRVHW